MSHCIAGELEEMTFKGQSWRVSILRILHFKLSSRKSIPSAYGHSHTKLKIFVHLPMLQPCYMCTSVFHCTLSDPAEPQRFLKEVLQIFPATFQHVSPQQQKWIPKALGKLSVRASKICSESAQFGLPRQNEFSTFLQCHHLWTHLLPVCPGMGKMELNQQ